MELKRLNTNLSVIQVNTISEIDLAIRPLFIGLTEDELSIVLPTENVPEQTVSREDDWQGFKIEGILDFGLVGILAKISSILANEQISIFALSTYNTDYILVKQIYFEKAVDVLKANGYLIK